MKNLSVRILFFLLFISVSAIAQKKLKKADRIIVANIQTHIVNLKGEKAANEYIVKQFSKYGLKPKGEKGWYQQFNIYDGRDVKPSSMLKINDDVLVLFKDYFPLAFSANKSTEASVAIALAENGVPWFKDIGELINDDDSGKVDTFDLIRRKAKHAAEKGASALIIYNKSGTRELEYNRYDNSQPLDIPVLYITHTAYKKYASTESDIIDVKLNVELDEKNRTGTNIIGFTDNGADSTIVTTADLSDASDVAALMEIARLLRAGKRKLNNYLFIAYSGEKKGVDGSQYYNQHPSIENVSRTVQVDSVASTVEDPKGLNLVKRSVEIIRNN